MVENKIGHKFEDKKLLTRALTHSSKSKDNYQRLEFLGDSILNFLVGEYLFKNCDKQEGELTVLRSRLVSEDHLSECFDEMGLGEDVIVGKSLAGEITTAIKGDIVESLIAAIYLDSDLQKAREFVISKLHIENFEDTKNENYKSQLQELIQANFKCSIKYETVKVDDYFEAKFYMDEDYIATGYGKDKTKAEQNCAYVALTKLFVEEE
ncbi:MAG: ribonuclease III [Clostridia bacterium]|nr:ribonuclease III [Clostridia bacterium]